MKPEKYIILNINYRTEIWEIKPGYRCRIIYSRHQHTNEVIRREPKKWQTYHHGSPIDDMVKCKKFATKAQVFTEML